MTQDMVERVARAMADTAEHEHADDFWKQWIPEAEAAITAVRESIVREMREWLRQHELEFHDNAEGMLNVYAREHNINLDSTQG